MERMNLKNDGKIIANDEDWKSKGIFNGEKLKAIQTENNGKIKVSKENKTKTWENEINWYIDELQ